jgi:putative selenium metabolism hydrolase
MDPIQLTSKMVQTPSLSGQEKEMADLVEETMHNLGFTHVERDEYGSIVGLIGDKSKSPVVLFDGHMDVVPAVGEWSVPPFSGKITNNRIFGRGSSDMKGGLASAICGVAEAAATGHLNKTVAVSGTVLEERVEGLAFNKVINKWKPEMVVICECTELELFTTQRGRLEIILTINGLQEHSSTAKLNNNSIVRTGQAIEILSKLSLPKDSQLGEASIVPTDIQSIPYPSITTTPFSVRVRFDRRTIFGEKRDDILQSIEDAIQAKYQDGFSVDLGCAEVETYTGLQLNPELEMPAFNTDDSHILVQTTINAMKSLNIITRFGNVFPGCCNGTASGGKLGIPTVIVGPGIEAHTPDESIPIEEIYSAVKLYKEITLQLAGGL